MLTSTLQGRKSSSLRREALSVVSSYHAQSTLTTNFPPLISPLLIRSKPRFTLPSPRSTSMMSGGSTSPRASSLSSHSTSARPTAGTSWNSLMGTV
ncbi:hypothetical protein VTI28DRAFT_7850 [Corynascus sepedonium]